MIVPGSCGIVVDKQRIGGDRTGFAESGHRAPGIAVEQVVGKHVVRTENTLLGDSVFGVVVSNVIETGGVVIAGGHTDVASADDNSTLIVVKGSVVGHHSIAGGVPQLDAIARRPVDDVVHNLAIGIFFVNAVNLAARTGAIRVADVVHQVADKLDVGDGVIAPAMNAASTLTNRIRDVVHVIAREQDKRAVVQNAVSSVSADVEVSNLDIISVTAESGARSQTGRGNLGPPLLIRDKNKMGGGGSTVGCMERTGIVPGGNMDYCSWGCKRVGAINGLARRAGAARIRIAPRSADIERRSGWRWCRRW